MDDGEKEGDCIDGRRGGEIRLGRERHVNATLVANAEKLTQQEVLRVHRHVGLELRLPVALGALKRAQMLRGTLDRGIEVLRRHDLGPHLIGYLPHRQICSGTDFHLPIVPALQARTRG